MSTEAAATAPLVMFGTAGRYANAIYAASAKKGEIDQVSADLALFKETMQTSPVLNNFCIDPSMGRDEKAKGVISLLTSAKACDTTKNSLASLAEGGRLGDVVKVIDMFESIVTAGKGDVKAVITSAEALPAAELAEITKQLTGLLVRAALRKKSSGKKTGGSSLPLDLLRRSSRHDRERNGGGGSRGGGAAVFRCRSDGRGQPYRDVFMELSCACPTAPRGVYCTPQRRDGQYLTVGEWDVCGRWGRRW